MSNNNDDTTLEPMDPEQWLSLLEEIDRPRRLELEWEAWVEVLRCGALNPVRARRLAQLIEERFSRGPGRPRDARLPDLRDEVESERQERKVQLARRGLGASRCWIEAQAEAIKVVAARHRIDPETLRKRLRRSAARDR